MGWYGLVPVHTYTLSHSFRYDPNAVTTKDGALEITLSATPNHGLGYTGGTCIF
jgi:hypothetical protein